LLLKIYSHGIEIHKRRSRKEIQRQIMEFESSGLRRSEFFRENGLALSTLQRQLKEARVDQTNPGVLRRKPLK
jgi:hypothetical protein